MSPLARHALARSALVTGSDIGPNLATQKLQGRGIQIQNRHDPKHLPHEGVVVYSSAIKKHNPELLAAWENPRLEVLHRSQFLAQLMQGYEQICISGTHGKTTTTALVAHMLDKCGLSPSAVVGGRMLGFDEDALIGTSKIFVCEADESDASFLNYQPHIACVTNIDHDHLDHYTSMEHICATYRQFLLQTPTDGSIIVGWDQQRLRDLTQDLERNRLGYGRLIGSDLRLLKVESRGDGLRVEAVIERDRVTFDLPLLGEHNALNALCALGVARILEVDMGQAAKALASFQGVARRMSLQFRSASVRVYDDYAHNPGKIIACIKALRHAYPDARLRVIFQPHRYSRMRTMFQEFAKAFVDADEVYVTPVYAAGETEDPQATPSRIAEAIRLHSDTQATEFVDVSHLKPSSSLDVFLTVGAGDVWKFSRELSQRLSAPSGF